MAFKFYRQSRFKYWSDCKVVEWLDRNHRSQTTKQKYYNTEELKTRLEIGSGPWESFVDSVQNLSMLPSDLYHSIRIYFKNSKGNTNVLDGCLEKGQWYDLDYRISRCLFNELDKFITQEKGLEAHEWEKTLVHNEPWDEGTEKYGQPTSQAKAAVEQEIIWKWWLENKDKDLDSGIESAYREQETEMLIRLIRIRNSLWT